MSLPLSGQLGGAQLTALLNSARSKPSALLRFHHRSSSCLPPAAMRSAAWKRSTDRGRLNPSRLKSPSRKLNRKKRKKRKKKVEEKQKPAEIVIQPDATAPEQLIEVAPVEPGVVAFPLEKPFNTAEYLQLIAEVQRAERLRETIAEEDELLLLGCLG